MGPIANPPNSTLISGVFSSSDWPSVNCPENYLGRRCIRIRLPYGAEYGGKSFSYVVSCISRCSDDWTYRPEYSPYGDNNYFAQNTDFQTNSGIIKTSVTPKPNNNIVHERLFQVLLGIVTVLIIICFILGVVLIIKSYMMAPLKQNLAVAIRRRRRVGHAPNNQYIPADEMRASMARPASISDRKSLPPPEVLMAARERVSQLMSA